ncbi:MAG: SDR family oxidoreductase [Gammaproteobacteria bacterium]|jgi:short-subunit dehydrogenase|nr:SDR family oxidoreductase [Gammaproteobacteria bacterium]
MNVLLIGANSAIATAVARRYALRGAALFLAGRDQSRLTALSQDLLVRGAAAASTFDIDLTDTGRHRELISAAQSTLGRIDLALLCHGQLPDQAACERDFSTYHASLEVNVVSSLSLLTELANTLESEGSGTIAVITSVAGDRGRRSNYAYGASKAMLSTYLQGLRGRLHTSGVNVVDLRPGLVDSPMTRALKKGPLFSSPDRVATSIVNGIDRGRSVVYAPGYWRLIMFIVRSIPERLFKRLHF